MTGRRNNPNRILKHILAVSLVCVLALGCSFTLYALFSAGRTNKTVSAASVAGSAMPADSSSVSAVSSSSVSSVSSASSAASSSLQTSSAVSKSASSVSSVTGGAAAVSNAAKPVWILVDIAAQRTTVYDADNRVIKKFVCSTGAPGTDTPTGTFHIQARGKSFFSQKYQEGGYYWMQFYGNYWFHSIPFDKERIIIPTEAVKLGEKASHGCVRLAIDDEKWMYNNIPKGTKVVIK
ncbi:MAG TPA: L,D-transpeptidase [Clostridia bacterium]|nr:L,D-transpeptidase [Clostridia bacterium]